ncbi:endolytic transglycosylase MltG [Streptomyces sp. NBC_01429]|uniref:endolytic transglycosylase MltG n=1 Tax=Streptomyces sp. NBC_01429 TaxID=2903862 RepID=UPI002E2BD39A|nr:endolytic transglycosylase MltG [Streptomyces sp. NBC_01429]
MTDYGRGPGSEPWHPEDPLYGDQGWAAQQATDAHAPYGGPQQHQQYPQQAQQQTYTGEPDPYQQQYHQQHQQQGGQQQYEPQQYDQQQYGQQQYGAQQYGDPQYGNGQYGDQGQAQQPQQHSQPQQHQQQQGGYQNPPYQDPQYPDPQYNDPQYNGGWDSGQQAEMPYGGNSSGPYEGQQGGYGESHDHYATPDAYPPPQPPGQRRAEPEPQPENEAAEPKQDEEEKENHPFFTGGGSDGDEPDAEAEGRGGGRSKSKKKKGRNGIACLVVAVVLVGGVGGVSYVGFQFWQSKFGPPPDFAGSGSGSVQVEIPQGAGGYEIGAILVKNGIVKSQRAFVSAQKGNPKGNTIQAGVYTLSKEMSAANAVKTMLSPNSRNALIIPEGTRNVAVYAKIDKQLGLTAGTTQGIAKKEAANLGLPKWAKSGSPIKDPLEGFLYPASYPVAKGTKPEAVLKKMVSRANAEYNKLDLEENAKKHDLEGPWQLLTVASLVQAEGKTHDDFRKMAEVVYNRLKPSNTETNQLLQFDSAFNYLKGQSKIDISESEINKNQDPYNTYTQKGLTPGPIGNPGNEALAAALNPTDDGWLYFVATDGQHKTEFAKTYAEFEPLRDKFNDRKSNG